jgi:hypothetical protein
LQATFPDNLLHHGFILPHFAVEETVLLRFHYLATGGQDIYMVQENSLGETNATG